MGSLSVLGTGKNKQRSHMAVVVMEHQRNASDLYHQEMTSFASTLPGYWTLLMTQGAF